MAQAASVKNVEALRNFGHQLQQMGERMYQLMLEAQRRMQQEHANNWRDDQTDRFQARFDESVKMIKTMSEEFAEYNRYVVKVCDIQEMYVAEHLNI